MTPNVRRAFRTVLLSAAIGCAMVAAVLLALR